MGQILMREPTLMVSKGWPDRTVQMPPKPPARKFLTSLVLCFSVMLAVLSRQYRGFHNL